MLFSSASDRCVGKGGGKGKKTKERVVPGFPIPIPISIPVPIPSPSYSPLRPSVGNPLGVAYIILYYYSCYYQS